MEPCPLGLRVLASAFIHKTVTADDVSAALRSETRCLIGTDRQVVAPLCNVAPLYHY